MEQTGLTGRDARRLLSEYGPNAITKQKKVSSLRLLFAQFASPLIFILLVALAITGFLLHEWTDTAVIGVTVVLNTFLGFFQEHRAQRALEALQKLVTPTAKVVRDGKRMEIDATTLVPGDIVILEIGRTVPADGELMEANSMSVNEAILTGEAAPVYKSAASYQSSVVGSRLPVNQFSVSQSKTDKPTTDKPVTENRKQKTDNGGSLVFMGTTVVTGIGKMRVTATGDRTKMGSIAASLVPIDGQKTPLQHQVHQLAKILGLTVAGIALFIFLTGSLLGKSPTEMFKLGVAVAVSAVPEGLAVSLTVILAVGMQRILKRHALVRTLVSAETLGSVTVICADKTGTLTEGTMRVTGMDLTDQEEGKNAIAACNDLRDSLEVAMFGAVVDAQDRVKRFPRLAEIPFSPVYKYIATLHRREVPKVAQVPQVAQAKTSEARGTRATFDTRGTSLVLFVSGAPEVLLEKSTLSEKEKKMWHQKFQKYAREGLRLVAVARREVPQAPQVPQVTQVPQVPQVAPDFAKATTGRQVAQAQDNTDMSEARGTRATFDTRGTFLLTPSDVSRLTFLGVVLFEDPVREGVAESLAEAQRLGLKINIVTGDYLVTTEAVIQKLKMESGKLKVQDIGIYARVTPEQKLTIVKDLKKRGEVVAMMGDGVNDAPALSAADISIVVQGASDVAREMADMVLLDNNFRTIVLAIREGRGMFRTFKKVMAYLLSDSFAEVILIMGAFMLPIPLPITAAMILWVNLIADGLPSLALTGESSPPSPSFGGASGENTKEIETRGSSLLSSEITAIIASVSFLKGFITLALFYRTWQLTHNLALARSVSFLVLVLASLLSIFSLRSLSRPMYNIHLFSNHWLLIAVAAGFGLLFLPLSHPLFQQVFGTTMPGIVEWMFAAGAGGAIIVTIEGIKWWFRIRK